MKKILFCICLIFVFLSCTQREPRICVYGNRHLIPLNLVPLEEQQDRDSVTQVQNWIYNSISEPVVVAEGLPYQKEPYTEEFIFSNSSASKATLKDYAEKYDITIRYILEGKIKVYGCENEIVTEEQNALIQKVPFNLQAFDSLNDVRSRIMYGVALEISKKLKCDVAIIAGARHLAWFEKNGHTVRYPFQ